MTTIEFARGRDLQTTLMFNGKPWIVSVRECEVEEVGQVYEDDVNGEDQSRPMTQIDGYLCTTQCFEDGSSDILKNFIAYRQNAWQGNPALPVAGGLRFNFRGSATTHVGGRQIRLNAGAFVFGGIIALAPLKLVAGGRKEALMHTVAFRAQTFTTTRAA